MPSDAPGKFWLEIVQRPTLATFAAAFTQGVVLDTSITRGPIVGAADVHSFFEASRGMYETISFTHETGAPPRTCLEWEGRFRGADIGGATVLSFDTNGAIERIQLYHRPYAQVLAYSTELARRLTGKIDPSILPTEP
jgi:hypothetical protein